MCQKHGGIRGLAGLVANDMRKKKGMPPLAQEAQSAQQPAPATAPAGHGGSARSLTGGLMGRMLYRSLLGG